MIPAGLGLRHGNCKDIHVGVQRPQIFLWADASVFESAELLSGEGSAGKSIHGLPTSSV